MNARCKWARIVAVGGIALVGILLAGTGEGVQARQELAVGRIDATIAAAGAQATEGNPISEMELFKKQDIERALEEHRLERLGITKSDSSIASAALPEDTDDDGMPNSWELANGLNPNDPDDAWFDPDDDQVVNLFEYQLGSDLNSSATPPVATVASSGADYSGVGTAIDFVAPGTVIRVAGDSYAVNYLSFSTTVVMIQGGWSPDFGERDLELYPTTFDGALQDEVLYFSPFSGETVVILDGLRIVGGKGCFGAVNLLASGTASMKTSIFNTSITQSESGSCGESAPFGGVLSMNNWNTSESDRTIANTLIAGNLGSGILAHITGTTTARWRIINTTISGNLNGGSNGQGIEAFTLDAGVLTAHIYNSIIWGNEQDDLDFRRSITFNVDHSDIGTVSTSGDATYAPGSGVVNVEPAFVQPGAGDFHLQGSSPLIDAGINQGVPLIDLEGGPRKLGSTVDMGPYEGGGVIIVTQGDVNCDNLVNVVDALFILQFEVGLRVDSGGCPLPGGPPAPPAIGWLNASGGDVSKDGLTNVVDALFILQCEVGIPNSFCPAASSAVRARTDGGTLEIEY